ncbi:MAG: TonB-dependent receptor [Gammaproteobacteria bacterium]|nr:TonB-dependent receptor [Gammaproteobacteria bacterium]
MRGIVMAGKQRRGSLLLSTVVGSILRLGNTAYAGEDPTYRFDIPPEPLGQALTDFSQAAAQQIIYSESIVKGRTTSGLHGSYTAAQALQALLAGTELRVDINSSGVLMIRTKNADITRNVSSPVNVSSPAKDAPPMERTVYQTSAPQTPAATTPSPTAQPPEVSPGGDEVLSTVVVTGTTSKRTLLDSSVAITSISNEDLQQKAPRSTADVLTLIPGIFVESTAGPVSNNYSVRGLPGGGQAFVRLIEDGMAPIYGGLNDDEVFQNDLSIDHVESLQGGSSGILTPNAAGASINFISRKLNFEQAGGLAQVMGTTYGERRADVWFSAPIAENFAFAASAYYDSNPGTRDSAFRYDTWHIKLQLEKRFDNGASVRFTYKRWDEHDPYYADQPYAYNNGKITSVPGLDSQFGNIVGRDFAYITVPDSCVNECFRTFSAAQGIHAPGSLYRVDINAPINDSVSVFARARYTQTDWDFNGVFAGSGTGNGGLASAVTYLTPGTNSPISSLLTAGQAAFPGTTQFGIRNVATGQVTPAANAAALNALNGNGLLQQTVLNQQLLKQRDWGSDFGVKWDMDGGAWTNSLTVGGMVYSVHQSNDQSGVAPVINDVSNQSNIYDVVAMNGAGGVLGTLTNNGLVSYGDWGAGISYYNQNSQSVYINNEFTWNKKLHFDFGVRYEHESETAAAGNSSSLAIPPGIQGVNQTNPNAFNGTFNYSSGSENPVNWTAGLNYTLSPNLSAYARYEKGYQTQGLNPHPTGIVLYEAGVTFADYGLVGTLRGFRTQFDNQTWGGGVDPANPNLNLGFFGNSDGNGVDLDATYRPEFEPLHAFSLHAQATYQDPTFSNVSTGATNIVNTIVAQEADAFYNGKTPGRTPNLMYTLTPAYDLPGHYGQVYLNYQHIGRIFADNGNQVALPGYGVLSVGAICNITRNLALNVSVVNVTNVLGLTEGNPRQGFTQQIVNGYFYGRGIVGPTGLVSLTYRFD